MSETPEISGLLYKKRGGFGKFMANSWQFRYFSISKDGILSYYDTDSPEIVRGKLDLKCHFELISDLPIEGAPNGYGIQIIPSGGEERWKLCADTKEDHNRWCKVLERYMSERSAHPSISCISDDEVDTKKGERPNSPSTKRDPSTEGKSSASKTVLPPNSPLNKGASVPSTPNAFSSGPAPFSNVVTPTPVTATATTAAAAAPKGKTKLTAGGKKRLKLGNKVSMVSAESCEALLVLIIVNISFYVMQSSSPLTRKVLFAVIANAVVARTLQLRAGRASATPAVAVPADEAVVADVKVDVPSAATGSGAGVSKPVTDKAADVRATVENKAYAASTTTQSSAVTTSTSGKPIPGKSYSFVSFIILLFSL